MSATGSPGAPASLEFSLRQWFRSLPHISPEPCSPDCTSGAWRLRHTVELPALSATRPTEMRPAAPDDPTSPASPAADGASPMACAVSRYSCGRCTATRKEKGAGAEAPAPQD